MKQIIDQKYRTVMCDPPWDINQKGKRGAARHYPLMTLDQIKAMPVKDLSEENAHLYLWIPNGLLQEGLDVITAASSSLASKLRLGSIPHHAPSFGLCPVSGAAALPPSCTLSL